MPVCEAHNATKVTPEQHNTSNENLQVHSNWVCYHSVDDSRVSSECQITRDPLQLQNRAQEGSLDLASSSLIATCALWTAEGRICWLTCILWSMLGAALPCLEMHLMDSETCLMIMITIRGNLPNVKNKGPGELFKQQKDRLLHLKKSEIWQSLANTDRGPPGTMYSVAGLEVGGEWSPGHSLLQLLLKKGP